HEVWTHNGRKNTGKSVVDAARQAAELGAGEVVVNSIDQDGTMAGYDLALARKVREAIRLPMSVLGGAGSLADIGKLVADWRVVGPWRLRRKRFDIIFVYGTSPILQVLPALVLRAFKRSAVVTWVQDLWPQSLQVTGYVRSPRLLSAVARVVRWLYGRSDLLL